MDLKISLALVLILLLPCGLRAQSSTVAPPPQATGYTLVWEDTFSSLSLCTTNIPGCNWYNPGLWWESAAGTITDPFGTFVNLEWASGQSNNTNISTASPNGVYYRSWTYGYFEVSMAFNPVTGSSPAIWMVPVSEIQADTGSNGVYYGEIDLLEWQSQTPTTFYGTIHVLQNGLDIANNESSDSWTAPEGTNFANYNTYGVLWTPTSVSWYFNNTLMGTWSTTSAPYSTVFGGSQSYFLIMSQQMGCNWTNTCLGVGSSLNMDVQWVHVYAPPVTSYTLSTATAGIGSGTVTGCAGSYASGAVYSCTVTANSASTLASVSGCGGSGTTTYSGTMPASNCTVTAIFNTTTGPTLTSISVSPSSASVQVGSTQQLTATCTWSNASITNCTSTVAWSSSSTSVATISSAGIATGVAAGSSTITAAQASISGGVTLTVTAPVSNPVAQPAVGLGVGFDGSTNFNVQTEDLSVLIACPTCYFSSASDLISGQSIQVTVRAGVQPAVADQVLLVMGALEGTVVQTGANQFTVQLAGNLLTGNVVVVTGSVTVLQGFGSQSITQGQQVSLRGLLFKTGPQGGPTFYAKVVELQP